jgi:hypothetical protein
MPSSPRTTGVRGAEILNEISDLAVVANNEPKEKRP